MNDGMKHFHRLMIIFKMTKTLTKWFIKTNLLPMFSLIRNQLYWKDLMMKKFHDVKLEFRDDDEMTWKRSVVVVRVAASERNSVGTPSVWRRRNQFCDLVPIRRIELESYFEIPFSSNNSSVFDLFFYVVQCVIYFCNLFCIIGHIK